MSEPFKQENIIGLFLKKAGMECLKKLRKVDEKWLYLDNIELEKRSRKGQLKPVEFSKGRFLDETGSNPQLFWSFRLDFQDAFKFLGTSFFDLYRPQFLHVEFPEEFTFTQEKAQYLGDFLGWISEDIQELQVQIPVDRRCDQKIIPAVFQAPLVFPNLRKFCFRQSWESNRIPYIKHFSCILDRSREFDPAPNLTFLELKRKDGDNLEHLFGSDPTTPIALSRWSTLTHLSLESDCILQRVCSMLLSLASAGMSLESLDINCRPQYPGLDFGAICSDLSQFFGTQVKSLKILKLEFNFGEYYNESEPFGVRNWWPIFKNVHTLKLNYPFFDMGPIPVHFPSLQNLELRTCLNFKTMYPDGIQSSSIPNLSIEYYLVYGLNSDVKTVDAWIDWVVSQFKSVVHLKCSPEMVSFGQRDLPWIDSLEVLEINDVYRPIKVAYLKALKKLVIRFRGYSGLKEFKTAWFDEALSLNLSSITFNCHYDYMPSDELKATFIRHFPFPVQFQEIKDFE